MNGPVFPELLFSQNQATGESTVYECRPGLSRLDYFAAHAEVDPEYTVAYAEAVVGRPCPNYITDVISNAKWWAEFEAKMKFIKAEAMLKAEEEYNTNHIAGVSAGLQIAADICKKVSDERSNLSTVGVAVTEVLHEVQTRITALRGEHE